MVNRLSVMKMLLFSSLIVVLALGCSDRGALESEDQAQIPVEQNGSEQNKSGQDIPVYDQKAELVFSSLGNVSEDSFNELYGNAITKKYPNFTLTYIPRGNAAIDVYMTNLLMSNPPDIHFDSIGNIPVFLKYQFQYDMTDLVRKHNLDLSQFEPAAVEGVKALSDGELYGLPVFNTNRLLFYNKELFNKFGVDYPTDGMSWDEAIEIGKRMTRMEDGVQYAGLSSSKEHHIRMNSLSIPLIDPLSGKPTINTDERWRLIFTKGFYEPYEDEGYRQVIAKALPGRGLFYLDKTLAMMVYLSFLPANEPDRMTMIDWDMVSEPYYKEFPDVSSQVYPTYFSVTAASNHKDEAMHAIEVLMSAEHQTQLSRQGQMPVRMDQSVREVLGQDTPYPEKNWQAVFHNRYAEVPYKSMYDVDIEKVYLQLTLRYAKGEMDLNTVLRNAEESAISLLESLQK